MTCYKPLGMFQILDVKTGKIKTKGRPPGEPLNVRCNHCIGCRIDDSYSWATRMMFESQEHTESTFLNLTYDQKSLPWDYGLNQKHMQQFFKDLRKKLYPLKIRYTYAGEYGENTSRPHYHAIVFGLAMPNDKQEWKRNERDDVLYTSEWLNSIWNRGRIVIGTTTRQSCAYVASYTLKDAKTENWKNNYSCIHPLTGKIHERTKPFARYSNRPGIGRKFFDEYKHEMFPDDHVVIKNNGRYIETQVPKYYFDLLKKIHPQMAEFIQEKRLEFADQEKAIANRTPDRLAVRKTVREAKLSLGKRGGSDGQ